MTTVAIIQARMGSSRLPGKVLMDLMGQPMLEYMLARVARAKTLDAVWVATTVEPADDAVAALCDELGIPVFRGDQDDVLERYASAAAAAEADVVVRLTADCPFADPAIIDAAVRAFRKRGCDYLSNAIEATFPDGLDVEVFSRSALARADREAHLPFHREHVTPYMRTGYGNDVPTGEFKIGQFHAPADFSHLRWTVDTQDDLDRVRELARHLPPRFGWHDVLSLIARRPEFMSGGDADGPAVTVRLAGPDDARTLFDWANRPDSLVASLKTKVPIPWETHCQWYEDRLYAKESFILIAEAGGKACGQARLDRAGKDATVSIYVAPCARGSGAGLALLDALEDEAVARWPVKRLLARVKADNMRSRRLFAKAGYGKVRVAADHLLHTKRLSR